MRLALRHVFNMGVVVILAVVVITASSYAKQAALLPLLVGIPALILAVANTIVDFLESRRQVKGTMKEEKEGLPPGADTKATSKFARERTVFLWVLGLFISLYLIGFIATTFFYTFLSLKVRSRFGWKVSLAVSAGSLAFLYIVMIYGLDVDLFEGVIVIALRKAILGYLHHPGKGDDCWL